MKSLIKCNNINEICKHIRAIDHSVEISPESNYGNRLSVVCLNRVPGIKEKTNRETSVRKKRCFSRHTNVRDRGRWPSTSWIVKLQSYGTAKERRRPLLCHLARRQVVGEWNMRRKAEMHFVALRIGSGVAVGRPDRNGDWRFFEDIVFTDSKTVEWLCRRLELVRSWIPVDDTRPTEAFSASNTTCVAWSMWWFVWKTRRTSGW